MACATYAETIPEEGLDEVPLPNPNPSPNPSPNPNPNPKTLKP